MAAIEEKTLRERLERRWTGMKAERAGWDDHAEELERHCLPHIGRYRSSTFRDTRNGYMDVKRRRANAKLMDKRGIWASGVLANGMSSGLTSPANPWFQLTTEDKELAEFQSVKEWLESAEQAVYGLFAKSNFYDVVKQGYRENGVFGTEAAVMLHDRGQAYYVGLTFGEYWIACDHTGRPDTLYRWLEMTVRQMQQRGWGDRMSPATKRLVQAGKLDQRVPVVHAIEPNPEREWGKRDGANRAWRSVYWEPSEDKARVLSFDGFDDQPFYAARWDTSGAETYGDYSPGMVSLPDLKQLQLQNVRKQTGIDFSVTPALKAPVGIANVNAALVPRGITSMPGNETAGFEPIWSVQPQTIAVMREDILETRKAVDEGFYVDVFQGITNMAGIQPRNVQEIALRNEEKMQQLGPVVDRAQNEKLRPCVDRAFNILLTTGQLPPPPEELQGQDLKIEFVSVMAQMQRAVRIGSMERAAQFVGFLAAQFPDVVDKFDADEAVDQFALMSGTSARVIRSDEQVAERREQRAQQEQAAQAAQMAPAAADGAKAAELLSRTDTGGGRSALEAMMGA